MSHHPTPQLHRELALQNAIESRCLVLHAGCASMCSSIRGYNTYGTDTVRLRCDRQQPCHNCVMRGSSNLCLYASRPSRRQKVNSSASPLEGRATSPVHGRLFDGLFYRSGSHWDSVLSEVCFLMSNTWNMLKMLIDAVSSWRH
jgi:hypothetical protein